MAKYTQKEMNAAINNIKAYFFQQGKVALWGKVQKKIEEKLGVTIVTDVGSLVAFLPNANAAQALATGLTLYLQAFYHWANYCLDPRINPFDPETRLDDYVLFLLFTWAVNDPKDGPAIRWDTTNLKDGSLTRGMNI